MDWEIVKEKALLLGSEVFEYSKSHEHLPLYVAGGFVAIIIIIALILYKKQSDWLTKAITGSIVFFLFVFAVFYLVRLQSGVAVWLPWKG